MAGRSRSHSEARWAQLPPTIVRCNGTTANGGRCKRVAEDGSVVCSLYGGNLPQVRRRAAERIVMTADAAASAMIDWMSDPEVPMGERVKIARDLLDRAGLVAVQMHQIVPVTDSPIMAMYQRLLSDPANLERIPDVGGDRNPDLPSVHRYPVAGELEEGVVDADVIDAEPESEPGPVSMEDTPPKIKRLADAGAFDRSPRR
jgi:hypothetical protein